MTEKSAHYFYIESYVCSWSNKQRNCEKRKSLNVEPFLPFARFQLRWFGHVTRLFQERSPRPVLAGYT